MNEWVDLMHVLYCTISSSGSRLAACRLCRVMVRSCIIRERNHKTRTKTARPSTRSVGSVGKEVGSLCNRRDTVNSQKYHIH